MKLLLIQGANMEYLGRRQPELYGTTSAKELDAILRRRARELVLGMGGDGHTASFFPGGDTLATALDPATPQRIIELNAPGAGETRRSFTLPALLAAKHLFIHIEGNEKQLTLRKALEDGPVSDMPIRAVLRAEKPVTIYWCP